MDAHALVAALQEEVPGVTLEAAPTVDLHTVIYAPAEHVPELARALRDRPDLRCTVLIELTAVDLHPREPRFELVYTFVSIERHLRVRMKVRLPGDAAHLRTD